MLDRLYGKFDEILKKHELFKVLNDLLCSLSMPPNEQHITEKGIYRTVRVVVEQLV